MDINELESFNLSDAVKFHKELNPKLWQEGKLDPEVRDQLLVIAEDFVEYLGISNLKVRDVTISGSNAAYSYTPHSDLDLHVLVDFNELPNNEVYQELFTAKKTLYNDAHDITVRDVPVELYVQDTNQPHVSLGEYSIVHDKWIRIPKKRRANFDEVATKAKYEKLGELIELALKTKDPKRVNDTIALIKRYRKSGLDKAGEFGPENLAYKAVRKQGLVQALHDLKVQLHTEKLSIDEYANEDYDPNGPPPGPEFKPTMPKGTVRVDVSDVYDWYKLGQHISNMKGLGKHDFGQGPPSTILSFGDEDTEHKYIQDLEKTGLTTTDIDPVDPNQPKGMKRQKTDPTFNVNEAPIKLYTDPNYFGAEVGDYKASGPVVDIPTKKLVGFEPADKMTQPKSKANIKKIVAALKKGDKLPPILVRKYKKGYQVLDGHHRFYAYKLLKKDTIPARLVPDEDIETVNETGDKKAAVLKIQKHLNKKYGANLDLDGKLGPLTLKSINKFMPRAKTGLADEPNKTTAVQGKKLKEASEHIPDVLYHATYKPRLKSIKLRGLGAGGKRNWEDSKRGIVYLAIDPEVAVSYAESSDMVPDDWLDEIIVLEIPTAVLDKSKLILDQNVIGNEGDTLEYHGIIPFSAVRSVQLNEASGYIPSAKEKNDPRFKTALTVDVRPDAIKKNAKAFGFKTSRAGIPPQARADGKIAEDLMREFKTFLGEQQEEMFPGYDKEHREKRLSNWLAKSWGVQNGKPQTFYHATTKDFDTFNTHGTGFASALGMAYEVERHGSFFAVDPKFAEGFIEDPNTGRVKEGGRVLPVHLSIQSPIDLRDDALSRMLSDEETVEEFKANDIDLRSIYNHFYELERWELFDGPEGAEFIDNLQKLGFDGAIINEAIPNDSNAKSGQVWVAFSPNQVKSVYNRGSFSPDDPRLTKESG